ncbi:MAG: hypothetical protein KDI87_06580 [Gammaproteobacteria bacterium]|nr:hypothetical protein [Gammaproteobacteria bacterium]
MLSLLRRVSPLLLSMALVACSTGAQQGAERGAKTGAVGGLVAGAVGSIFWGGDAVNNALRSAAVGASSGAAVGAMHGAEQEKKRQSAPASVPAPATGTPVYDPAMKARIGELNFAASEDLARCRHVSAISKAERAFRLETDAKRRNYALLIEAIAAEESNNTGKANEVYAQWGKFDPAHADRGKARTEALDGVLKLQKVRQEQGLPPLCS